MSLPKNLEDRLSVTSNTKLSDEELTKLATRFIQDSQFVYPGEPIRLDFFGAVAVFKAGYALGSAKPTPLKAVTNLEVIHTFTAPITSIYNICGQSIELKDNESVEVYTDGSIKIVTR